MDGMREIPAVTEPRREPFGAPSEATARAVGGADALLHAAQARVTLGLSPGSITLSFLDWLTHLANAPFHRADLIREGFEQWRRLGEAALGRSVIVPPPQDHRFQDPSWQAPPFNLLHQSFLLAEEWWAHATATPPGVARPDRRIVGFAIRQWLDTLSPSNVPWLNPEVIGATVHSGGANLREGFTNFLADAQEAMSGQAAHPDAPVVGVDLAATPGKVVLRNGLIELIQYTPATGQVRPEPVLIVPAWIMKYYILDLSAHNSLIRWLVGQGYTVFAISWRNPDADMRDTTLDDYRTRGVLAALDAVRSICGTVRVHATGYCLGGTLLSLTAAAMARDGDDRLASVTLFCAQTDFTEAGELQLFITEDQLAFLDDLMRVQGFLDSRQMAGAFQLLRSNDLIWSRAIRSYLLGEREHPSDLMAWNADGTRMPARMHAEYLRHMFLNNDLAEGRLDVGGRPVSIGDIRVPFFVVGTETDHIAPWRSVFKLHLLNDGELTFVLASGGHNAGVVSEPGHPHRHYRLQTRMHGERYVGPDEWAAAAERRDGSWWLAWGDWLAARSGPPVAPPPMGSAAAPVLGDAPGDYVFQR
ncbi:PHA/PHB synthase family protein [Acidisphaera rubrifaciens]|uniref:Poly-beta-hydroxybutyrate polymerase/poly(3-hydroxyalkanoate) polymerase n=1 Tax=Acidisphaera rubrifaciens HS-AP3 TaxID=1231350 RepID=A0A0D6P451_9PROT|nr:alpha/beta fold hydrolase [Acidisphaera rubrifaciens]GAN76550.1 poly-beta-hydroxybutyrate polymerase/poly(3-hydroxyalkanoate) polymerase [Acidisphaera rubrifaciens HS-AP3]